MSLFGEIRHDIARLREIARVMARHGFAPALQRMPVFSRLRFRHEEQSDTEPAGERFAHMLEELGPTFVKVGQILSTRADLLPKEFTDALAHLQDQVPPFPFDQVRVQVEAEFGQPLEELFEDFDPDPLASASMAQVHTARVRDTDCDVVVKVQRPGIDEQVRGDASILVMVAQLLEFVVAEASTYRARDLAEEFEKGLNLELDFSQEARNLLAFADKNKEREGIFVPALIARLSGRTVMTMERVHGRRITALRDDEDPALRKRLVERLIMVTFEHVFVDGLFHGDPHPGNVFVTDKGELAFIDFGLVGHVSRGLQDRMLVLMVALSLRDADTLARVLVRIGDPTGRVSLGEFSEAISRLLDRYLGLSVAEVNTSQAMNDLVELSTRFGVRMPRELALMSKASASIDGIVRDLHGDIDPSRRLAARSQELALERLDPRQLTSGSLRAALQLGVLLQDLPLLSSQALLDLERGNLTIRIVSDELDRLERNIRGLGMTVFGGLMSSALTLGGIYVLARYNWEVLGIPVLPAVGFLLAGGMFGVAFTWFITGGQFPKLSLASIGARLTGRRGRSRARRRNSDVTDGHRP